MSVPVRYSAATVNPENIHCTGDRSVSTAELRRQRMSEEGRLGMPDAAGASNINPMEQQLSAMAAPQQQPQHQHELPTPSSEELFAKLHEALALEAKFQPCLYLPQTSSCGEVTVGARDGAAHILRCLKVWYDLPSDVLFAAINLVDRFLTKMKVKPKHMACISVGSFHLAMSQLGLPKIDAEELVAISQSRCTAGDLERMAGIVGNKLGAQMGVAPITSLTCLRLVYYILRNAAIEMDQVKLYDDMMCLHDLEMQLEVLACDAECASVAASELAMVLICTQMDTYITSKGTEAQFRDLIQYALQIQKLCKITPVSFYQIHTSAVTILSRYNGQHKMPYRQRLVWKLSSRTMRVLRPTDKLTSHLPTIEEHNNNHFAASNSLSRLRTGSVSSEEGEDWPTSPVIPVYEQC